MKAINHNSVYKGYLLFSVCMLITIAFSIFMSFCYVTTYTTEAAEIETRSKVFDQAFTAQVELVERIDSLYNYVALINSDVRINNTAVINAIKVKRSSLLNDLNKMREKDILLHKGVIVSVDQFIKTKDSIIIAARNEENIKAELQRCITSGRQTSRKLAIAGINNK